MNLVFTGVGKMPRNKFQVIWVYTRIYIILASEASTSPPAKIKVTLDQIFRNSHRS